MGTIGPGSGLPPLILMTDSVRLADPLAAVAALHPGTAMILRHYDVADRAGLARALARACRARRVRLLIAGDVRLALAVGAGGVHLPEFMVTGRPEWRAWWRPGWLVTAAAHSPGALFRAARAGADAALLSPVFATASHPEAMPIGTARFAAWARNGPLPVYALGGVNAANFSRLRAAGAAGFAGIGGLTRV